MAAVGGGGGVAGLLPLISRVQAIDLSRRGDFSDGGGGGGGRWRRRRWQTTILGVEVETTRRLLGAVRMQWIGELRVVMPEAVTTARPAPSGRGASGGGGGGDGGVAAMKSIGVPRCAAMTAAVMTMVVAVRRQHLSAYDFEVEESGVSGR